MAKKNTLLYLLGAIVVIVAVLCFVRKGSVEGYIDKPLSAIQEMKRTPVDYAFIGNGMSDNPHYQADPTDKLVPLEYGTVDLWNGATHMMPPVVTRATQLANDSKLRLDMADSGDMNWHRYLNNIPQSSHLSTDGRPLDADGVTIDYNEEPLYSPVYHYDHYLGF